MSHRPDGPPGAPKTTGCRGGRGSWVWALGIFRRCSLPWRSPLLALQAGVWLFGSRPETAGRDATRPRRAGFGRALAAGLALLLLALLSAPHLALRAFEGYGGDSFLTLSPAARAGLAALSLALALCLIALATAKSLALYRRFGAPGPVPLLGLGLLDLAANLLLFHAFVWLSPQIYYLYYLAVFDGLAWQWVIKPAPPPSALLGLLALPAEAALAQQGLGLLGRALLLAALAPVGLHLAAALRRSATDP